jgi:hypothetical protein
MINPIKSDYEHLCWWKSGPKEDADTIAPWLSLFLPYCPEATPATLDEERK